MLLVAASLGGAACVGTTGSDLVTFDAAAAGPADATPGQGYAFTSGRGYQVVLTRARLHVGAVYLDKTCPTAGAQETGCILPGNTYVAQVTVGPRRRRALSDAAGRSPPWARGRPTPPARARCGSPTAT